MPVTSSVEDTPATAIADVVFTAVDWNVSSAKVTPP